MKKISFRYFAQLCKYREDNYDVNRKFCQHYLHNDRTRMKVLGKWYQVCLCKEKYCPVFKSLKDYNE